MDLFAGILTIEKINRCRVTRPTALAFRFRMPRLAQRLANDSHAVPDRSGLFWCQLARRGLDRSGEVGQRLATIPSTKAVRSFGLGGLPSTEPLGGFRAFIVGQPIKPNHAH